MLNPLLKESLTKLNANEIKTLAVLAYNRTLVQHYGEALLLYQFLSALEPGELRWQLGAGICLVREGAYEKADLWLHNINDEKLAEDQNDLLVRLRQQVAYHKEKPTERKHA